MSITWHKIADAASELPFPGNELLDHEVAGKTVCLARKQGVLFAVAHKCPHSGAVMSQGWIDARGHLICPLHKYRFDMKNGRNVSGEGYVLKHWPVEEREDGVYIGLDAVVDPGV